MRLGWVALFGLVFTQGCASSYEPARSPRIATVVDGGQPTFVRNGEHFGSLVWGTGLVDAVHGNPQAERHARIGRNLIAGGFSLGLAGLGGEIGALAVYAHDRNDPHSDRQFSSLSVGLLLGGLTAALAGSVIIMSGQPHLYDAINIYNDGLDAPPATTPLGPRLR